MSKYYKAEDVIRAFKEWLAISEAAEDIIADLPTIDAISREHLKSFEYINKGDFNSVETIREWIDNAPSVIPQMPNEDAIGREELIKALIREKAEIFRQLVEIIKVLATVDSRDATEAIIDAFGLAETLGVKSDLERVAGADVPDYKHWTDLFCIASALENRRSVRRGRQMTIYRANCKKCTNTAVV